MIFLGEGQSQFHSLKGTLHLEMAALHGKGLVPCYRFPFHLFFYWICYWQIFVVIFLKNSFVFLAESCTTLTHRCTLYMYLKLKWTCFKLAKRALYVFKLHGEMCFVNSLLFLKRNHKVLSLQTQSYFISILNHGTNYYDTDYRNSSGKRRRGNMWQPYALASKIT